MKTLLQYLVLVGIPILGVLGILRMGQGLTAPQAVSGIWQVTPSGPALTPSAVRACPAAAEFLEQPNLSVEQSGPRLVFDLSNFTIHGTIEGQAVRAASERIAFDARLESSGAMNGTLGFPTCPDVPSISFIATPEEAS